MEPTPAPKGIDLDIHIEELEPKIAPLLDGGVTVLPLPFGGIRH